MNNWTEVIIHIAAKDVDNAGAIANMVVPYGIYIEDYSNLMEETWEVAHIDLIDEELLKKDPNKALIHIYLEPEANVTEALAFLKERYTSENIIYEISTENCIEEDWMNNWKKYFKPLPVGEKLLIHPVWEDEYDAENRVVLHLEPGVAFGTGTHETTRLCLELIEKYLKKEDKMLDVGCGSGILSVAALLLGAKSATAIDIDALAVKTAKENAKINQVEQNFTALQGSLTEKIEGKFEVVAANIVADVIIDLTKDIKTFLSENGFYIISGIIDTREADIMNALQGQFKVIERREEKGWVALALVSE